jgi:hypothetical protein
MPRIQLRRDTSSNWSSTNPTLYSGELGVETDTLSFKIGDGSTTWNSLGYTSLPDGVNNGDVLTWNSSTNSWAAQAAGGGTSLPNGTTSGYVLTWDNTSSSWYPAAVPTELPSATGGQVLTYNSSTASWEGQTPSTPGLPNGTTDGQVLTWDGGTNSWNAEAIPAELPAGTTDGQVLTWDGVTNSWNAEAVPAELPSATSGQVLTYNATTSSWEGQTPSTPGLPSGSTNLEPLIYDTASAAWKAAGPGPADGAFLAYNQGSYGFSNGTRPGPSSATTGDILRYNGSHWEAQPFVGTGANHGDILFWEPSTGQWVGASLSPAQANILCYSGGGGSGWVLGGLRSDTTTPSSGDVLTYDGSARWIAQAPGAGSLPSGTSDGQVLTWDSMASSWVAETISTLPGGSSNNQVLTWDNTYSSWYAGAATGLPSASSNGYVLTWNSAYSSWEGAAPAGALPSASSNGYLVAWNSTYSSWEAVAPPAGLPSGSTNAFDILYYNATSSSWAAGGLSVAAYSTYALTFNGSYWEATATPASSSIVIVDVNSSSHTLTFMNGVLTSHTYT